MGKETRNTEYSVGKETKRASELLTSTHASASGDDENHESYSLRTLRLFIWHPTLPLLCEDVCSAKTKIREKRDTENRLILNVRDVRDGSCSAAGCSNHSAKLPFVASTKQRRKS